MVRANVDSGFTCLALVLRALGISADPSQLAHRYGQDGQNLSAADLLRVAQEIGFNSTVAATDLNRLEKAALPAIAETKAGEFFVLAKVGHDGASNSKALVYDPDQSWPILVSEEQLDAAWTGRLIYLAKRA